MDWFIIRDQDHLGPFTQEELEELYASKEISDETLVWNESLKQSVSFSRLDFDSPPPLPPELSLMETEEELDEVPEEFPEEFPDEVSEEEIEVEREEELEDELEEELEDELENISQDIIEEESDDLNNLNPLNPLYKKIAIIVLILITPVAIYFYQNKLFSRPSKMSLRDYERLTEIVEKKSEQSDFVFALAQDRSILWVATNNPNQGKVAIKLKAVKNKFLGEGEIEAFAFADLKSHLLTIKDFKFKKGLKLLDGYYEVELYTPSGLKKPFLGFAYKHKTQFQYFKNVLISTMKSDDFEKVLRKYAVKKKNNESQFWSELKQKYQTLKMITQQIQDGVRRVFDEQSFGENKTSIQKKIQSFESEYKKNYGNFFTNFVIANDRSYEDLVKKNFPDKVDIISNYTRLSKLARSIGMQSVEVMQDLERFNQWQNPRAVKNFKQKSLTRFQKIIDVCDYKVSIIQTE
jgi:hypothetical protein